MKLATLECWPHQMQFVEPYTIAYETLDSCTNVFLKLEAENGLLGWGCSAPDLEVTGETAETVLAAFKEHIEPMLRRTDLFRYAFILQELREKISDQPAALAMLDMALLDMMAQHAELPLYLMLGGYRHSIPTSITIGIMNTAETVEKAEGFIKKGFKVLKIKGGSDVEEDIERMIKVREAVGTEVELRFDANQGYSLDESMQFLEGTKNARLELLEQPTKKGKEERMGKISSRTNIPVMADESLMNLQDVFHLTRNDFTDMINIKLMKTGGIIEAMHINSVAKAAGVEAMVGCMDESALGISAGMHFALSRPNIQYADLDGHLDLLDDPFAGMIKIEEGILYPSTIFGLGVKERI